MRRGYRIAILVGLVGVLAAIAPSAQAPPRTLPPPEKVIGFRPCSDYKLATYEQIADYLRHLDAASERLTLVDIGKTAEGRTQLLAIISSEENLRNLARYKDISRRLALAQNLDEEHARALAREGKAVVWIDFGLHSTEVGHAQTAPLLAYKMVSEDTPEVRLIRDNVIFLLVPNMNPDGTTLVARWYMTHVGKPWEMSLPELYHKYAGHDNNRDFFMFTQPETRNVGRVVYHEWFPQIVYNQHQAAPFPARIFVPPFDDPMNPRIPPLVMRGVNLVGDAITRRLEREGKRGAISRINFDTWWNGGMRTAPYFHNMIGILTETAHPSPTPRTYDPKTFPRIFANGESTLEPSTYYPSPYLGGEWHLSDTCDYMLTASMAVLEIGASRREEWLYDIYRMGRDQIRAGADELYVIPAEQWDEPTAAKLVNVLRWGAVEVERAKEPFRVGSTEYPAGSYLVRGAQPFRAHAADLLEPQRYPDRRLYPGGPPERPYDITGWTLPFQMGVKVDKHSGPPVRALQVATERVDWAAPPQGSLVERARVAYALDPRVNDSVTAVMRLLKAGETVYRTRRPIHVATAAGRQATWPAGTFLVAPGPQTRARLEQAAVPLGLHVGAVEEGPSGELWRLRVPRVGLYHGWGGNADEGWTRWVFEQFEVPYTSVYDRDLRAGDLTSKFDVIVLPDATYERMLTGLASGSMPPEYTGGMTPIGVHQLYRFTLEGGTLVTLDRAAALPLAAFGLPVRNVTDGLRDSEVYVPGSLLRLRLDPSHPIAYGMPEEAAAFFIHSPAFATERPQGRGGEPAGTEGAAAGIDVVARYPASDLLLSGWLLGERVLANRAAVVQANVGNGRVVLLGFRTQHRGQPHGTFKLLFNAVLLGASERATFAPGPSAAPGGR